MAIGLYSMPYWSSGRSVATLTREFASNKNGLALAVPGRRKTSGFCQCVMVASVSRKSMMLITYWLSCASSSAVSTARGGKIALSVW